MRRFPLLLFVLAAMPLSWASDAITVKFELRNKFLIVVRGSIADMHNLAFVPDTGTTRNAESQMLWDLQAPPRTRSLRDFAWLTSL